MLERILVSLTQLSTRNTYILIQISKNLKAEKGDELSKFTPNLTINYIIII